MSGIQPNIPIIKEMYMTDGVHLNDNGHKLVAERLGQFLKNI